MGAAHVAHYRGPPRTRASANEFGRHVPRRFDWSGAVIGVVDRASCGSSVSQRDGTSLALGRDIAAMKWLSKFAASQENVDRVATRLAIVVAVLGAVVAVATIMTMVAN